jgi:hypothetical protein
LKIAFVTGCLEPGRDGVGDYVHTLAAACVRAGHEVRLLALAEPRTVPSSEEGLSVRRQTLAESRADGGRGARAWLDAFRPDWTSLHFVPYAFDSRGLFSAQIPALAHVLAAGARRHIFFHEIWIAFAQGAPWRERAVGFLQRRAMARLLRAVSPTAVQTSNGCYRRALTLLGYDATVLPIFGSVPWQADTTPAEIDGVGRGDLVCGMFGALHPNWAHDPFLADFATLAAARGQRAVLAAAGSLRQGAARFAQLAERWRGQITFVELGEHPPVQLAAIFARFDFAVTTSPYTLIGKSASAAALREHGLRVVVTNSGQRPRFRIADQELSPGDDGFVAYFGPRSDLSVALAKTAPRSGVESAVHRFLATLHAHR